ALRGIKASLLPFVEAPHLFVMLPGDIFAVFADTLVNIGSALFWPLLIIVIVAAAGPLIQNGPVFSPKAIGFKTEKISPIKGAKRLFSGNQLNEFVKGVLKISIVAIIGALPVLPLMPGLDSLTTYSTQDFLAILHETLLKMLVAVVAVLAVIAIADLIFQRYRHKKQLRMTKQEVKEEHKQSEGDPTAKQRLRQIRQERARQRMMAAVPEADVVITNPTHYAVALKYDEDEMEAPRVTAKGQDLIAQRIREIAEENDITIVENPPLARALFASVDLDDEVPPEHYQAVAEVISYVWGLRGGNGRAAGNMAGAPAE
ncbi:MAG TPA: flagellar biosynthesis protein FlhB, partial [Rhodospirillaceae bacterium]|nr:flagellar biosynthesis protein FlhB [Rhodospirillaceae bacterium]